MAVSSSRTLPKDRRNVFLTDEDRELYLSLLKEYAAQYSVGVIGYCLMTNHVHLIVVPGNSTALAKALGRTHSDYARAIGRSL
jgi:putative transposase